MCTNGEVQVCFMEKKERKKKAISFPLKIIYFAEHKKIVVQITIKILYTLYQA